MKFGKLLLRSIALSCFEARKWMDYKNMKHLLYIASQSLERRAPQPTPGGGDLVSFLASVPQEVEFFRALRAELGKVASTYAEFEASLVERYTALMTGVQAFVVASCGGGAGERDTRTFLKVRSGQAAQLLAAAVRLTSSLIQLENYAVLNYCAFAKIMKKKEKVSGVQCKTAYMQAAVNVQDFAHYPRLLRMLSGTERAYSLLVALQPDDAALSVDIEDAARLADLREVQASSSLTRQKEEARQSGSGGGPGTPGAGKRSRASEEDGGGQPTAADPDGGGGSHERPGLRRRVEHGERPALESSGPDVMRRTVSELELAVLMTADIK